MFFSPVGGLLWFWLLYRLKNDWRYLFVSQTELTNTCSTHTSAALAEAHAHNVNTHPILSTTPTTRSSRLTDALVCCYPCNAAVGHWCSLVSSGTIPLMRMMLDMDMMSTARSTARSTTRYEAKTVAGVERDSMRTLTRMSTVWLAASDGHE